jgi:iron complex transport system substrate-binding protein
MAARSKRLIGVLVALAICGYAIQSRADPAGSPDEPDLSAVASAKAETLAPRASAPHEAHAPRRIISLVPSLTESLFAIGAGAQVVGVGTFDSYPPEVKTRPRVGGLVDPDIERILSLRPDLVVTYGSQVELERSLARAGIRTFAYRHGGVADELRAIRALGGASGHTEEAEHVARSVEQRLDRVRAQVRALPRPKTLLVIDRQPGTLRDLYVSGGRGFLHDLLEIAGGADVFGDIDRESVQPSTETLLARAPEVIVELRAPSMNAAANAQSIREAWSILPSLPAVRRGRIVLLTGDYLVEPGPRMAQAAEAMARAIHPEVVN